MQAGRALAEREYETRADREGRLQAPNRAHDFRTFFEATGIRLHARTAPGAPPLLALSLDGVGRGGDLRHVEAGQVVHDGARAEIRRGGLVEWFENSEAGLEHGFTLTERPTGAGPLALELALEGARVSHRDQADLVLETPAGRRLRYGGVQAWDARGEAVPARLEVGAPGRLRLLVEDGGALYPLVVDPLLTTGPDTLLASDQLAASFGISVAGAGDVNGDGYDDVIVGARGYDAGEAQEGAAFVFLGGHDGVPDGGPPSADTQLEADIPDVRFGYNVSGVGDVDGDGYDDVIVSGEIPDSVAADTEHAAYVFLGSAAGIADGNLASANAEIRGIRTGFAIAPAGDVDGDGYDDVILGSYVLLSYEFGGLGPGGAVIYRGSPSGIASGSFEDGSADTELLFAEGEFDLDGGGFGWRVAGIGDVNDDGYDDVAVSAIQRETVYVYLGSPTGIAGGDAIERASSVVGLDMASIATGFGEGLAGAGDVDGDGFDDLIVGAPAYDVTGPSTNEGAAFVFHGSAAGIPSGGLGIASSRLESATGSFHRFGESVAAAGDVNADGYGDVIVRARPSQVPGAAYVFLGGASGVPSGGTEAAAMEIALPHASGTPNLTRVVAGAGDVDSDGHEDLITGQHISPGGGMAHIHLPEPGGVASWLAAVCALAALHRRHAA